ncbi:triose-phosphate isomerase [Candidatus Pelagibacter sp.]|nr:triose-phosphate isomerase [Candidatus Pelagibacter sp.]
MTNKLRYFVANWKMFGHLNSINSLNKVINFKKKNKKTKNLKIIYCPPFTLIHPFIQKLKNTSIMTGAQNCSFESKYGPPTGSINAKMIKSLKCEYVILGHSEKRAKGEKDNIINKKIISALESKLKVIFCIGETSIQKKRRLTKKILLSQIIKGLKKVKNKKNILIAYEPVWSIGSGVIPKMQDLENTTNYLKLFLSNKMKFKNPKVLYGGSVNTKNISILKKITNLDGFLIGGASQNSDKFIDIIKKTFN